MPARPLDQKTKILYIEDNRENRLLVRAVLEAAGYLLVDAEDGLAGIEAAIREEPALILLDINLPGVDGYEIVAILKSFPNLAGNSLKFTRQGHVKIAAELRGDRLVYRVSDTGIGIAQDKIAELFAPFRQSDATISSEFGGTGLGLSITRKFVELHGGRIWVESELGRGSTFFIEVPLRVDGGDRA